jgi:hypothetical protein
VLVRVRARGGLARLSLNNQLLVALATPDASFVAGFRAWLKLGYCVRKGEKAIRIIAPVPIEARKDDESRNDPAGARRMLRIVGPRAPRVGERLVERLVAALAAQTVAVPAEEAIGRVIRDLAVELDGLAAAREQLAEEIEQVFLAHPQAPVLLSIPGIGARTGLAS